MENNFLCKDISEINLEHSYFHYTNKQNINTIFKDGLEPRIGENSLYVEKTPKVFFVEGETGIITIMDVWFKWLTAKSSYNKFIYWLGTMYMRIPFCIKCIPNYIVKRNLKDTKKRNKVYEKMKYILDNSVFLVLNLTPKEDFDYNDVDEVKNTYYESFLKLLYPSDSDIKNVKMEYWNMHTYSGKVINPKKISLLMDKKNYSANTILVKIIENNLDDIKYNYDFLYEYYIYIQKLK